MTTAGPASAQRRAPVRGTKVRVRTKEEILATLDASGARDGLVFSPEMLQFCGQELEVSASAHKTCDIIGLSGTSRRLTNTLHLRDVRCDGSAHAGCQAGCLLFWREEWLEYPDAPGTPIAPDGGNEGCSELALEEGTRTVREPGAEPVFRCQATDITEASTHLRVRELDQYVKDVRTGNVPLWWVVRGMIVDAFNKYQKLSRKLPSWLRISDGRDYPFYQGTGTGERLPRLNLRPGELVEIKSRDEIMATLSSENKNRGMWFDQEQLPFCGTRAWVNRQVSRIVDERTGKIIRLSDAVVLDDVVCLGIYRRACPRAVTPYWREAWLRRVDEDERPESAA